MYAAVPALAIDLLCVVCSAMLCYASPVWSMTEVRVAMQVLHTSPLLCHGHIH